MQSDLQLESGGQTARFAGAAHAIHYDFIFHTNRRESRAQLFGVVGGGVKAFFGTGTEEAFQPLSQFGYFTKTQSIKPMASVGGGVMYRFGKEHLFAGSAGFHHAFPTSVLTPAPGVK